MNKFDFVELTNIRDVYETYNLYLNAKGFIIEENGESSKVLFLNGYDEGDYAFVSIVNEDLKLIEKNPPKQLIDFIKSNLQNLI